jgi:hypothetical protein
MVANDARRPSTGSELKARLSKGAKPNSREGWHRYNLRM